MGVNAGGVEAKSAGDKVQDLYGILHNTTRGQMAIYGTAVGAGLAAAAIAATGGLAGSALLLWCGGLRGGVIGSGVVKYFS